MNSRSCRTCVNQFFDKQEEFVNLWFYMAHSGLVHVNLERDYDLSNFSVQELAWQRTQAALVGNEGKSLKTAGQTEPGVKSKKQNAFNY